MGEADAAKIIDDFISENMPENGHRSPLIQMQGIGDEVLAERQKNKDLANGVGDAMADAVTAATRKLFE